ncbi:uncharacterized protein LOC103985135 [Musa acuminata AAA Group]|uniref:uncharacterized protein LOC135586171 n=1 Tax=Musa acuminata AAA Group TaxID=214697 RepID=UPI0031DEACE4
MSKARAYADVNVVRPKEYWDYVSLTVHWGVSSRSSCSCSLEMLKDDVDTLVPGRFFCCEPLFGSYMFDVRCFVICNDSFRASTAMFASRSYNQLHVGSFSFAAWSQDVYEIVCGRLEEGSTVRSLKA